MSGAKINYLNKDLVTFREELKGDDLAQKRVEIAIVTFHSTVTVEQDFITADQFEPPTLIAQGKTSMGEGIKKALDLIGDRKKVYKQNGVEYYRPWVFMITDGAATDEVEQVAKRLKEEEEKKSVAFFAVGVEGADMERLGEIVVREPLKLKGLCFRELFQWLSASVQSVSHSQVGEQVPLQAPTGWGSI